METMFRPLPEKTKTEEQQPVKEEIIAPGLISTVRSCEPWILGVTAFVTSHVTLLMI